MNCSFYFKWCDLLGCSRQTHKRLGWNLAVSIFFLYKKKVNNLMPRRDIRWSFNNNRIYFLRANLLFAPYNRSSYCTKRPHHNRREKEAGPTRVFREDVPPYLITIFALFRTFVWFLVSAYHFSMFWIHIICTKNCFHKYIF